MASLLLPLKVSTIQSASGDSKLHFLAQGGLLGALHLQTHLCTQSLGRGEANELKCDKKC